MGWSVLQALTSDPIILCYFFTGKRNIVSIVGGIPSMLHLILKQVPMSGQMTQSLNLIYFVDFFLLIGIMSPILQPPRES